MMTTTPTNIPAPGDGAAAEGAAADAGRRLLGLVVAPNLGGALDACGWRACGVLACVSRGAAAALRTHDDARWRAACFSIASERALYAPEGPISSSWRKTFNEHLHPARDKWAEAVDLEAAMQQQLLQQQQQQLLLLHMDDALAPPPPPPPPQKVQHFNIAVVARFRPGRALL